MCSVGHFKFSASTARHTSAVTSNLAIGISPMSCITRISGADCILLRLWTRIFGRKSKSVDWHGLKI